MRYLIFAGQRYYAQGGGYDLRMDAAILRTAKGLAEELIGKPIPDPDDDDWDWGEYEWSHVLDIHTGKICATYGHEPYGAP